MTTSPPGSGPSKPPRILLLYASVGAGHGRAAEAVQAALERLAPQGRYRCVDALAFTNPVFRRLYGRSYFEVYDKAPHLLGYFYDLLDRPPRRPWADRFRLLVERWNLAKFLRFLSQEPWDLIVNTHFLPPELVGYLLRAGSLGIPQITAVTDFDAHRLWVHNPTELYFAGSPEGRAALLGWGVPDDRVTVTGIPIDPVFSQPASAPEIRRRKDLTGPGPVVLQLAGGVGVGPVEAIYRGLLSIPGPLQLVVVAGKNESLQKRLRRIQVPAGHRVQILGFTQEMHEWVAAADLAVTKPGGLTSSECLARGVPMAIVCPIPGQETRNSDYLLECGAAVKINHLPALSTKLASLLADPDRLNALRQNARRAARPEAARDIAGRLLDFVRSRSTAT